jgi:FkbM family methyltransferase
MESLYRGGYEPEIAVLLERFLHPGMTFIDVGANIGYISALGLERVGETGSVHAFEPVPYLHDKIAELARLNPAYHLRCNPFALGEKDEIRTIHICNKGNIGWNTLVPELMPAPERGVSCTVRIRQLSGYLFAEHLDDIGLIKIDVEGFELPVLRGTQSFFEKTGIRPPIICEVAPEAYPRLQCSLSDLKGFMSRFGYTSYDTVTLRRLDIEKLSNTTNVLFCTAR